jgi:hypothetical protein
LQMFAGDYHSIELNITYELVVENDNLALKLRETSSMLTPYSNDTFGWGRRNLKFKRDNENKITGFVIQAGIVKNIGFGKIEN